METQPEPLFMAYSTERRMLQRFIPEACRTLLDVGCYSGGFGAALKAQRTMEVWGVEPVEAASIMASEKLDRVINDFFGPENPIPDGYFDAITFNDSLEHFAYPEPALELCKRKLRSGGVVIACIPNVRFIGNVEHLLFDKDWRYESEGIRDRTHLRFFTAKSMTRMFDECGYDVIEQVGVNPQWWDSTKKLRRLFFRIFPKFTEDMRYVQYVTVARPRD